MLGPGCRHARIRWLVVPNCCCRLLLTCQGCLLMSVQSGSLKRARSSPNANVRCGRASIQPGCSVLKVTAHHTGPPTATEGTRLIYIWGSLPSRGFGFHGCLVCPRGEFATPLNTGMFLRERGLSKVKSLPGLDFQWYCSWYLLQGCYHVRKKQATSKSRR